MLRIGLTGSIAVGKSYVAKVLRDLGCHVIDADLVARQVVAPGSEGLHALATAFGLNVLNTDGTLNRTSLGVLVFNDEEKRLLLNSLLHPYIIAEQDRQLKELEVMFPDGVAVVDAALLIESGGYKRFDKLIVVYCKPEIQLQRLMARDGLTRDEAVRRVNAQMPQEEKQRFADYLIDTSTGLESTRRQTERVFTLLQSEPHAGHKGKAH